MKKSILNWRLWIGVYGINFIFAAILTLPIAATLTNDVSRSLAGRDLMNGFNYKWGAEFANANGEFLKSLLPQMVFVLTVYVLIEVFFAGGFYSTFSGKARTNFGEFLAKGSTYFFTLLFITIIEIALLFSVYIGVRPEISFFGYRLFAVALFLIISLFSDFIRAAVVIDHDNFWNKIKHGAGFTVLHPLSTMGVYLGGTSISAVVIALYSLFYFVNDSTTGTGVFVEIAAAQVFIVLRIFSKLIFYAGEAILYKENQIEVINVKPEMLE